jgi:hypothetical protein
MLLMDRQLGNRKACAWLATGVILWSFIWLQTAIRAVPAFELATSQPIFHSKDLSEKNLT